MDKISAGPEAPAAGITDGRKAAYVKFIISLLIFGTNGVVAGFISLTSAEIVFSRTVIGTLFLIGLFAATKKKPDFAGIKRQLVWLLLSGAAMGSQWVFLYMSYRSIGVSTATMILYCGPVVVMALSPLLFREKLTGPKLLGIAAVLVGMFFINGGKLSGGISKGLVISILSALTYALMIIANKKVKNLSGLEITLTQLAVACLIVGPYAIANHQGGLSLTAADIAAILFLGTVNTGFACYLYFSAINRLPTVTVSILSYIEPCSAVLFSSVVFRFITRDTLSPAQLLGAALILGGAAFGELMKPVRKKRPG